jgi:hypothetical protein
VKQHAGRLYPPPGVNSVKYSKNVN